jgi:hypothetical protein
MLKRRLAQFGVTTPRFDFAAVTYLQRLGFDLERRLPELFPRGELALALEIADDLLPVHVLRGVVTRPRFRSAYTVAARSGFFALTGSIASPIRRRTASCRSFNSPHRCM